jgi:ADP-ribosyl-[dinitrogen reductase] hydrolase
MTTTRHDRITGALVGLVLGDAFGAPIEWLDREEISTRYPGGFRDFVENAGKGLSVGQGTDDTDMALLTTESLILEGGLDLDAMAPSFVAWGHPRHDLGQTTSGAIAALKSGVHWSRAGSDAAPSSGCLPRCAPVALAVREEELGSATVDCCRMTHRHSLAVAASVAQNLLVARLVHGAAWADAVAALTGRNDVEPYNEAWAAILSAMVDRGPAATGAPQVLAEAFHAVADAPNAEEALVAAVSIGGDTDTRGAVAGLIAGARWGLSAFPSRWLSSCQAANQAERLAGELNRLAASKS